MLALNSIFISFLFQKPWYFLEIVSGSKVVLKFPQAPKPVKFTQFDIFEVKPTEKKYKNAIPIPRAYLGKLKLDRGQVRIKPNSKRDKLVKM